MSDFDARQDSPTLTSVSAAKDRARRHYQRAIDRLKMRNPNLAVQELLDAIEADPTTSEYHALLAKIHLDKALYSLANVNLRQALKLNPNDPLAQECLKTLQARSTQSSAIGQPDLGTRLKNLLSRKL